MYDMQLSGQGLTTAQCLLSSASDLTMQLQLSLHRKQSTVPHVTPQMPRSSTRPTRSHAADGPDGLVQPRPMHRQRLTLTLTLTEVKKCAS